MAAILKTAAADLGENLGNACAISIFTCDIRILANNEF